MPGSVPNEDGLRALGRNVDASRRPATSRRRKRIKRTLLVLGIVIVVLIVGGLGYGYYLANKVHRVSVKSLTPGATGGADAGTTNILLVGSTTRCGLQKQTPAFGLCTKGVSGVNSDVIMILHLNPSNKTVRLLSIPRDLFIPNSRDTGTGYGAYKIANSLYQGPSQLVAAIEEDFGIPIQHYVELNFDTFASVVTALGGVTMEFPEPVHDAYSGLNVLVPGCHHLNGFEALQVVRARHLQYKAPTVTATTPATWPYETQSDLARIRRDHEFLRVLASKVAHRGLSNPASDFSLISALAPNLTVDSGMSVSYMASLALTFHGVSFNTAPQWTLPVRVDTFGTYRYRGFPKGDVEFPAQPTDQAIIDQFLGINNDTNSLTGQPLPSPRSVTVSVLNGTGVATQAGTTSQELGRLGFQMVGVGTTTPVGTVSETLVTYDQRTPADEAAAQLVARSLSGSVILAYGKTADGADVTVTTGTDFSVNSAAPSASSTPSSTAAPSTSTAPATSATTPTSSSGGTGASGTTSSFTPPTKPVNALKPYDPRACPPGVTGTTSGWGS
jgi:LCP family protein required for cell wall assembly